MSVAEAFFVHAGEQVPSAGRGDREAGGPGAGQRAERGPGGAVQRGEPVHRPGPVEAAVDADHHGRAGERDRPVGGRHPQGVVAGVGRARPRLVTRYSHHLCESIRLLIDFLDWRRVAAGLN